MSGKTWKMPKWMEAYRAIICNTGGNPIEEMMNDDDSTLSNNSVRVCLISAVKSQIAMLQALKAKGWLR